MNKIFLIMTLFLTLASCTASYDYYDPSDSYISKTSDRKTKITLIRGIHISEMPEILGAPNSVLSEQIKGEKWIYKNISSEVYFDGEYNSFRRLPALIIVNPSSGTKNKTTVTIIFKDNLVYSYSFTNK